MSKKTPIPNGVEWPVTDESSGKRSTTITSVKIWAAATAGVDDAVTSKIEKLGARGWRKGYDPCVEAHAKACLKSPEAAIKISQQGLDAIYDTFEFHRDGKIVSVAEAMENPKKNFFYTGRVEGKGKAKPFGIPFKGRTATEDYNINAIVNRWVKNGTIEPDAGDALKSIGPKGYVNRLNEKVFVLLGAAAAMGPFRCLMDMGATVIALDVDFIPGLWKDRLIGYAAKSAGTLIFPLKKDPEEIEEAGEEIADFAGCNLITQAPELADWISGLEADKDLVIGSYVYLNGPLFVKVSVACDAVISKLLETRNASLGMLGTPTDVYVVPEASRREAQRNSGWLKLKNIPLIPFRIIGAVLGLNMLRPNYGPLVRAEDDSSFAMVSAISNTQGPNYILSKRMQQWRCMLARESGHTVSFNVAPTTATASVMQRFTIRAALSGLNYFPAVEVFQPDTSNSVMTGMLLHDVFSEGDGISPANPEVELENQMELFKSNAIHGGAWRMGFQFESLTVMGILIYFFRKIFIPLVLLAFILYRRS